jgi:hypothetical protein
MRQAVCPYGEAVVRKVDVSSSAEKQSATLAGTEKALAEATAERDALRKQSDDSAENRALNRRIEIVLQPNLSELPSLNVAQTGS